MNIIKFVLSAYQSNCYLLYEENKAFIIDPGYPSKEVYSFLEKNNLNLTGIYITHGHIDHYEGSNYLKNLYPNAPVYAPSKDKILFDSKSFDDRPQIDNYIKEKDIITILDRPFVVYETPGHSPGGTVLYHDGILFTGDTLFYLSIGRSDLPYSNTDDLYQSVLMLYQTFKDDTICYPGHGRATTIGFERLNNPFIKDKK